jgi:hypothetical protein
MRKNNLQSLNNTFEELQKILPTSKIRDFCFQNKETLLLKTEVANG